MKNEHATCQANDIKQKRLLGGNPTKEKKIQICFLFPYLLFFTFYFIFVILLFFYFNIEDNVVF